MDVVMWILNIQWECFLINKVCQWFYQLDHVTFSANVFWSVNFALPFCQICCIQKSTLNVDISTKKLHKLQEVLGSHVTTFMTSSCDPIYQGVSLM